MGFSLLVENNIFDWYIRLYEIGQLQPPIVVGKVVVITQGIEEWHAALSGLCAISTFNFFKWKILNFHSKMKILNYLIRIICFCHPHSFTVLSNIFGLGVFHPSKSDHYSVSKNRLEKLSRLFLTTSVSLGKGRGQHAVIKLQVRLWLQLQGTNQSKAGKSKLFCDWLTKQRPGWH